VDPGDTVIDLRDGAVRRVARTEDPEGATRSPTDTQAEPADAGPTPDGAVGNEAVIFFWRPACGFCASLRRALEGEGVPLVEINIWEDARAAEAVRSITGGDETVPTVVVGEVALVNPTRRQVLKVLRDEAPHLLRKG
jgi:glutaredoxin